MTRPSMPSQETGPGCPPVVLDWIAWYPDGDLPDDVRGAIDAHAAECAACREEIARMQGDEGRAVDDLPDPDRVFARLRARIHDEETGTAATVPGARAPLERPRRMWVATRRVALAASITVAIGAGLVGAGIATAWNDPIYGTVGDTAPAVLTEVVQLDVVFRPDIPFGRLHDALNQIGASIVAGPTRGGVMRLHLPTGSDAKAVAAGLRAEDTGVALFAEPVVP